MAKQATAESELESIAGRKNVVSGGDAEAYHIDGVVPAVAVRPGTYDEVGEVLRFASAERLAVIPHGGGTMRHVGNLPRVYDIALDLRRLNAVVEHEAADLTVTCQAGITLEELAKSLAPDGQTVPFEPALPENATAGGVVAAGASGAARMSYGAPRDFTIGMRVITADGRVTQAGGKVVKNVAGYDLCKLYTGSRGTLGVIVETTFKVLPLPSTTATMFVGFEEPADACAFASSVYRHGLCVRGMTLSSLETGALTHATCLLALDIAGTIRAVERTVSEVERLASTDDAITVMQAYPPMRGRGDIVTTLRIAVRPTDLPSLIAGIGGVIDDTVWAAFPVLGVIMVSLQSADRSLLEQIAFVVGRLGGACTVEGCPVELKQEIDVFGPEPPAIGLMRRIKREFDPLGILSPGRFAGKI